MIDLASYILLTYATAVKDCQCYQFYFIKSKQVLLAVRKNMKNTRD